MYDGMLAETVTIAGHGGDRIPAYLARPLGPGPVPGRRGDPPHAGVRPADARHRRATSPPRATRRSARTCTTGTRPGRRTARPRPRRARRAVCPTRSASPTSRPRPTWCARSPTANGKVGVIGYCSGGRQSYVVACSIELDAAVDCYGGRVVASEEELTPAQPVAAIDMTPNLGCPLLGLFGAEDRNPSPEMVAQIDAGAARQRQGLRVPLLRGRGPRLLQRRPAELQRRRGHRRLAEDHGLLRPPPSDSARHVRGRGGPSRCR